MSAPSRFQKAAIGLVIIMAVAGLTWEVFGPGDYDKRKEQTTQIILQLASDIDALKNKNGRLPTNQTDLAAMLGHPVPLSAWQSEFHYTNTSPQTFRIWVISPYPRLDIFDYESNRTKEPLLIYPF